MRWLSVAISWFVASVAWGGSLSVSPNPRDFGSVSVSSGASTGTVTLTNTGTNTTVSGFTMGSGCSEFTASATGLPVLLGNGSMLSVAVTYDPVDRGSDPSCVVTIIDTNAVTDQFTLSGAGIGAHLSVSGAIVFSAQRWNGGTPETVNITITNTGEESVTSGQLTAAMMTGGQGFSIGSLSGTIAAGGGTATLPITFDPSSLGPKSDTAIIGASNDPPGDGNQSVAVSGTGTESAVAYNPSPLAFGSVSVGASATSNVTLTDTGAASLHVGALAITGANLGDFAFTDHGCSGQTCSLGTTVTITPITGMEVFGIRCSPSVIGARSATLGLTTSDDPAPVATLALNCTGQAPNITVTPTLLTFPSTTVGTSAATQTFTVGNASGANVLPLMFDIIEIETDYSISCNPTCSGTLAPGNVATVTVTFTPTASGSRPGAITVDSNDPDTASVHVNVTGFGLRNVPALDGLGLAALAGALIAAELVLLRRKPLS
jgi:hypothetical protein